jgi:hypothetical protein
MLGRKAGGRVVTTEKACKGMFKDLGKESMTYGCMTHARGMSLLGLMPANTVNGFMYKALSKAHLKQLAEGRADKK